MSIKDFTGDFDAQGGLMLGERKADTSSDNTQSKAQGRCGMSYECAGGGGQCGKSYECSGG